MFKTSTISGQGSEGKDWKDSLLKIERVKGEKKGKYT